MDPFLSSPARMRLTALAAAGSLAVAACMGGTGATPARGIVPVADLPSDAEPTPPSASTPPAPTGLVPVAALSASQDTVRRCRTVRTPRGQQVQCILVPQHEDGGRASSDQSAPSEASPAAPQGGAAPTHAPAPTSTPALPVTTASAEPTASRDVKMDAVAAPKNAPADSAQQAPYVTVNFLNDPLADVLSLFSAQTNRSIIASDDEGVGAKKITGDIRNQPWRRALDLLMRSHGLRVVEDSASGVLTVVSESRSLSSCLPRVVRLEYAYAEDVVPLVQKLLGVQPSGSGEGGARSASQNGCDRAEVVATGNSDKKSSTMVIFTTNERMDELNTLVKQLDVRRPMVGIQVRMVFVNRSQLQKFGWQYTLTNQVTPPNGGNGGNGGTPGLGGGLNPLTGVAVSPIGGAFNQQNGAGGGSGRPFTVLQRLALGGTTSLNMFVEAMQSVGLAQTEAQPMIVTQSENTANISVGTFFILPQSQPLIPGFGNQGFGNQGGVGQGGAGQGGVGTIGGVGVGQPNIQPGANPGGGGVGVTNQGLSNPAFGFAQFQTGTVLKVTPQVLTSGEIRVAVEVSRDGGELGSSGQGLSGARQYATTNVIVRNGQDIPIGGMRVLSKSTTKGGIPVLSSIPLLGRLFQTNEEAELFQDLMIIVTPTVIE